MRSSPRRHRIKRKMVNKQEVLDINAKKENEIEVDNEVMDMTPEIPQLSTNDLVRKTEKAEEIPPLQEP